MIGKGLEALEIIRDYHNQISLLCKGKLNNRIVNAENQIEQDLEQLDNLEKEIGIDLITLFKALKQMFVFHKENVKIELLGLHIKSSELYLYGFVEDSTRAVYLGLKDYGKTWTLTKEEVGNE